MKSQDKGPDKGPVKGTLKEPKKGTLCQQVITLSLSLLLSD